MKNRFALALALMMSSTAMANVNPVSVAGTYPTLEAGQGCRAFLALDGRASSDGDGDGLLFTWTVAGGAVLLSDTHSATPTGYFPLGSTEVMLTVDDGHGGVASSVTQITVTDTVAPLIEISTDRRQLWPPNHSMIPVRTSIRVTDNCPTDFVVLGASSEPDRTNSSPMTGDVAGRDGFAAPVDLTSYFSLDLTGYAQASIPLRAERKGGGSGRIYTLTLKATDNSGNLSEKSTQVTVPHDMRK